MSKWTVWHDGDDTPFATVDTRREAEELGSGDFDYIEEDLTARQWAWNKHAGTWEEL